MPGSHGLTGIDTSSKKLGVSRAQPTTETILLLSIPMLNFSHAALNDFSL